MSLRVYNTLSGQKEDFVPVQEGKVGMYVCGVTVYDYCHVGHGRSAVAFDVVFRYLKYKEFDVTYVRNFTDIDDKIINRANERKVPWNEITETYILAFYEDLGKLNILLPTQEPKATENIQQMFDLIESLIEKDMAYEMDGDVYYAIESFKDYGHLSGKKIEDLEAGARVEVDERKRNPMDFALWKKSKHGEPFWKSPWGEGRPGWHIECSAMHRRYLGETFDIHGGGKDLVFPHHENEIAQSHGATGCAPVKYWMHNGFVNVNEEKMSKSLGNFFTLRDIYEQCDPEILRFFLLSAHYRSPIDFTDQILEETGKTVHRFYDFLETAENWESESSTSVPENWKESSFLEKFETAMDDDFNTALAIGHLNDELRWLNKSLTNLAINSKEAAFIEFTGRLKAFRLAIETLGIFSASPADFKKRSQKKKMADLELDREKIESLIAERKAARSAKDWEKADASRDALIAMGVTIEDTADGTIWKVK
jgi:cysteinyl-tRNA synthetase